MKRIIILTCVLLLQCNNLFSQEKEILIYHPIKTDKGGKIISWYNKNSGKSYNHVINLIWNFRDQMRMDMNGLPYYMNHQVWNANIYSEQYDGDMRAGKGVAQPDKAIRELNWATYMVDFDGKNKFSQDEPWLTDGYGDYVRHYLRVMDAIPSLTPPDENHIFQALPFFSRLIMKDFLKSISAKF